MQRPPLQRHQHPKQYHMAGGVGQLRAAKGIQRAHRVRRQEHEDQQQVGLRQGGAQRVHPHQPLP